MRNSGRNTNIAVLSSVPTSGMQEGDECVVEGCRMEYVGGAWRPATRSFYVNYRMSGTFRTGSMSGSVFTNGSNGAMSADIVLSTSPPSVGHTILVNSIASVSSPSNGQPWLGVYRIVDIGSASTPWKLERLSYFPTPRSVIGVNFGVYGSDLYGNNLVSYTGIDLGEISPDAAGQVAFAPVGATVSPTGGLQATGRQLGIKTGAVTKAMLAPDASPYLYQPCTNPWYVAGSTNVGIPNNSTFIPLQNSSGYGTYISIPQDPERARTWKFTFQLLVQADSANWTPVIAAVNLYNSANSLLTYWETRSNSNQGRTQSSWGDWLTLTLCMPFSVPSGTSFLHLDPFVKTVGPYGGQYNRDPIYNSFFAERMQ